MAIFAIRLTMKTLRTCLLPADAIHRQKRGAAVDRGALKKFCKERRKSPPRQRPGWRLRQQFAPPDGIKMPIRHAGQAAAGTLFRGSDDGLP
jgi:hypothetical protein